MIFTGHLKRGNKGPFCGPNGFNNDYDNIFPARPSSFAQNDCLKPKLSVLPFLDNTRTVTPIFIGVFTRYVYTKSIYVSEKKYG